MRKPLLVIGIILSSALLWYVSRASEAERPQREEVPEPGDAVAAGSAEPAPRARQRAASATPASSRWWRDVRRAYMEPGARETGEAGQLCTARVVESRSGDPIVSAVITLSAPRAGGDLSAARAVSDDDGGFCVPERYVALGELTIVRVEGAGYVPVEHELAAMASSDGWVIPLQRVPRISGDISLPNGVPAARATVFRVDEGVVRPVVRADEHGAFEGVELQPGEHILGFQSGQHGAFFTLRLRPEEKRYLNVRLEPMTFRRLRGRVVDAQGAPVRDARITIRARGHRDPLEEVLGQIRRKRQTRTSSSGFFALMYGQDGWYELELRAKNADGSSGCLLHHEALYLDPHTDVHVIVLPDQRCQG
jgi:hypothetical protein